MRGDGRPGSRTKWTRSLFGAQVGGPRNPDEQSSGLLPQQAAKPQLVGLWSAAIHGDLESLDLELERVGGVTRVSCAHKIGLG